MTEDNCPFFYVFINADLAANEAPGFDFANDLFVGENTQYEVGSELSNKIRTLAQMYNLESYELIEYPQDVDGKSTAKLYLQKFPFENHTVWLARDKDQTPRFTVRYLN